MKLNRFLVSAAFVACCGAAAPLSAAVVQVQYTGTVADGYDSIGVFGTANTSLTGEAFTANYTFETTYGFASGSWYHSVIYGGCGFGCGYISPSLGATLTINGNTVSVGGNWLGYLQGQNDGYYSQVFHQAVDLVDTGSGLDQIGLYNSIYSFSNALSSSLTDPFSYSVVAGDTGYGHFDFSNYAYGWGSATTYAWGSLTPNHVTINAPIPEPETYAMLLAGLGLLGFAACRRKQKEGALA